MMGGGIQAEKPTTPHTHTIDDDVNSTVTEDLLISIMATESAGIYLGLVEGFFSSRSNEYLLNLSFV